MDKMREEFQKWFYDQTGLQCKFDSYDNAFVTKSPGSTGDTIVNTSCCIAWQSWLDSRAALCAWKSVCDELPNPDYDPVIICFKDGEIFESEVDEDGIYCNICGLEFSHWMPKSAIPIP